LNRARSAGGRIIAVGTTSLRVLESLSSEDRIVASESWTRIFITPGFAFRHTDALITNFHLPESTLLALVMAFTGVELTREAYATAIRERYRFYSYGDAMLIID
jgi:S-adenosylmethionine:tRNA ribosyltransferase-isomerase